jgi:type IV secretory pathway VirB2 component (pilin)
MKHERALRAAAIPVVAIALIGLSFEPAFAQAAGGATGNIGTFIQNIIDLLNNNVIRGLAVLAIIITGLAWMFGHIDLRRAGTVVVGIIVVFGAATIVDLITGGGAGGAG